ncbi:metal-dependent transcriptional regulator [Microbacteriaceae bacterium VKM Ac-2855]|nr:metal-dependent transcriptional regulator [Microbacteriaceae bacterium VKM Ac-2855]
MDIESISPVAQDYLKAIWSATEWGEPPITGKALAERFGTTPANITDTVKRLAAQGLVVHEPYRPVVLTPAGERYAIQMVRRHRLLESFLVTTLGYSWDEVHDEAERLEHACTDLMIDRIDALLGHPERDPHGDPIPTKDGRTSRPQDAVQLSEARDGRYSITRISDDDPALLAEFEVHGLGPGADITVTAHDEDRVVATPEGSVTVGLLASAAIWLLPRTGATEHSAGAASPHD